MEHYKVPLRIADLQSHLKEALKKSIYSKLIILC